MRAIIEDVRSKLANGAYKNEEHVRVCIVLRILQALGWTIWNPGEVNLEFPVLPNEDQSRIDVALFLTPPAPRSASGEASNFAKATSDATAGHVRSEASDSLDSNPDARGIP